MDADPNQLPSDVGALRQMVIGLLAELDAKDRRLQQVQHWLEQLLRHRYGQKRERVDENQLFLFAAELAHAGKEAPPAPQTEATFAKSEASKSKGHGRQALPKSLERRRVVYDLNEHERQCPQCQGDLKRIGEESSEQLEYVPASFHVIEEACQKYACVKGCTVVTAAKPMAPIEKGLPGPGLLAQVAVSKYGDHIPLNRQEEIYQRQGVDLSRQTMCDWMAQAADLVSPLYEQMKERVLRSKAVQTDDTPVPVLDPELPRTRTGRIWTYVGDEEHPYTVYDYTPTRSRDGPDAFLKTFTGYLQADAYSGYDQIYADPEREVVEVACWAHYLDSGIIRSCRPNGVPDGVDKQRGGYRPPDNTAQSVSRNARSFGEGLHRRRVRSVRPERFQKASSTSRFILRLVVMYRLVVATEACPR